MSEIEAWMFKLGVLSRAMMLACSVVGLSGCAGRGGVVPYDTQNFGAPDPVKIETVNDYRIGPSDTIEVTVFGVPEYSGPFVIDSLGRVQMPLVGNIPLSGRTADDAALVIGKALDAYLQSPQVQVQIKSPASQRITVDGSVGAPGVYPIVGGATLLQAVALARGTTETANPRRTIIFRTIDGKRMAAAFDLRDIRRGASPDPEVFANDIIVVDGSNSVKNLQLAISSLPVLGLFTQF